MIAKIWSAFRYLKYKYKEILFIALLFGIAIIYNYPEIAFKRPQSVHKWRQSDCASIALNYYQHGMSFFKSETNNLTSDNGTSGVCATSEIPILYYSVAALYKVFGYHDYIYRIFNTLLFFLGLFFLFRILLYLLKDTFWAIALSLLFFTSPVLVYYGNNFLSNSSALAFSIIGWYYFIRFLFESKPKWFYVSMAIFLLAAALKVTALFSVFAIAGICILELLGIKKFQEKDKLFARPFHYLGSIFTILFIIGLWLVYAHNFNLKHDCTYFSTNIFPIWSLDSAGIKNVLDNIINIWLNQYFHQSVLLFLIICFLFLVYSFRKTNVIFSYSVLIIVAEVIVYFILQFWTFRDHDYYTIDIYILPILIVITVFDLLKRHYQRVFNSVITKSIFTIFLLFNIYYAHLKIIERYEKPMNDFSNNKDLYSITPYLRQIGISPNDTIISIPDPSHFSLYLMNQKGWTEYSDARFNDQSQLRINYNQDSLGIHHSIDKGAKYLIINGIKELYFKPYLQSYCTNLLGYYNNVLIFDLKNSTKNFNLNDRKIKHRYFCNAELLSSDGQNFIGEIDSSLFQGGTTISEDFAHSGKSSSKLSASSPYGMTIKFNELKNGESFLISAWRKASGKPKGGIIASSNQYYNSDYNVVETNPNGWEKISKEFFITDDLVNQELGIYFYNPEAEAVYFDDLEIVRYESVLSN